MSAVFAEPDEGKATWVKLMPVAVCHSSNAVLNAVNTDGSLPAKLGSTFQVRFVVSHLGPSRAN